MNPRRIPTGTRTTSVRHNAVTPRRTVYDGALRVEEEPYKIVKEALADYLLGSGSCQNGEGGGKEVDGNALPILNARSEWRKLLPTTGFIRPSVDGELEFMTVTELTLLPEEKSSAAANEETKDGVEEAKTMVVAMTTVAVHQSVPILALRKVVKKLGEVVGEEPLSMRGGGDGGLEEGESAGAAADQEQDVENESNLHSDEVTQPAVEDSGPPDDVAGGVGNVETTDTSDIVGATAAPVENAPVESKEEDVMEVDETPPAAAVESAHEEIVKEAPSSNKPSEGVAVMVANTGEESGPPPPSAAAEGGGGETAPKAPSLPETKPIAVLDSQPAVAADGGDANIEKAPEATASQGPIANVGAVDASNTVKQPSEAVTTVPTMTSDTQAVASSTVPTVTSAVEVSSSTVQATTAADAPKKQQHPAAMIRQVIPLPSGTQFSSSLYRPSTAAAVATTSTTAEAEDTPKTNFVMAPAWYDPSNASQLERRSLPEWFNHTAPHRTATTYIQTREKILDLSKRNAQQFITSTAIRRSVIGDAGSLLRLHNFLMDWGLLNGGNVGETSPSDGVLRGVHAAGGALSNEKKRKYSHVVANQQRSSSNHHHHWSTSRRHALEASVVRHVSSSQTTPKEASAAPPPSPTKMVIDWNAVAADVGGGVTAADCQRAFIEPPTTTEDATNKMIGDHDASNNSMFSHLLDGVHPEVLKATIEASLKSTNDVTQARKASFVAVMASAAATKGTAVETQIENTLMDIIDQRVQRLENRAALLDDVEALLEAERVSLELERRDMYTTRCRHWFGDGST